MRPAEEDYHRRTTCSGSLRQPGVVHPCHGALASTESVRVLDWQGDQSRRVEGSGVAGQMTVIDPELINRLRAIDSDDL